MLKFKTGFCVLLLTSVRLFSVVRFAMPDTTLLQQGVVEYPILATPDSLADSLVAYQFDFRFDPECLDFLGMSTERAFTALWGNPIYNEMIPGRVSVAGFNAAPDSIRIRDASQALLFVRLQPRCDTSQVTVLKLQNIRVFKASGEMEAEANQEAAFQVIVNYPPVFHPPPLRYVVEDDTFSLNLADLISDENHPLSALRISITWPQMVSAVLDTATLVVFVRPAPDWYGVGEIRIEIEDPFGETVLGVVPFQVLPRNDPPGPFDLIAPEHQSVVISDEIDFEWEGSENRDPEDEIRYRFYLSSDSLFSAGNTFQIPDVRQTSLHWRNPLTPGIYYWKVIAWDQEGVLVPGSSVYAFIVSEPSGIIQESHPVRFRVQSIAPNPCNPGTVITFSLPEPGPVRIELLDIKGRVVRRLLSARMPAGLHRIAWEGTGQPGNRIAAGKYIVQIANQTSTIRKTIVVIR